MVSSLFYSFPSVITILQMKKKSNALWNKVCFFLRILINLKVPKEEIG